MRDVTRAGSAGSTKSARSQPQSGQGPTPTPYGRDEVRVLASSVPKDASAGPAAVVAVQQILGQLETAASVADIQRLLERAEALVATLAGAPAASGPGTVGDQAAQLRAQLQSADSAAVTLSNLDSALFGPDGPAKAEAIGKLRNDPELAQQQLAKLGILAGSPIYQAASLQASDIRLQTTGYTPPSQPGAKDFHLARTLESSAPPSSDESDSARISAARATLARNASLEKQALARLSPADRSRYEQVALGLADHPEAHLVLQDWLIQSELHRPGNPPPNSSLAQELASGRPPLVGKGTASDGGDVLTELDQIADPSHPLAQGLSRGDVLSALVREAANPVSIAQDSRNTCGPTSLSLLLDRENPAEYARLVAGLAARNGTVKLANGDPIARTADWSDTNDGGRAVTQRLLQPALENYANWGGYSNTKDSSTMHGISVGTGTLDPGWERLQTGLFNRRFDDIVAIANPDRSSLMQEIANQANAGQAVPVAFDVEGNGDPISGGHYALVTAVKNGRVYIANPWGEEDSLPEADFTRRLFSVSLDPTSHPLDPQNAQRLFGLGFDQVYAGAAELDPFKLVSGLGELLAGAGGELADKVGLEVKDAGDSTLSWARSEWQHGGIAGKAGALLGFAGGGVARGAGEVIQDTDSVLSWGQDKISSALDSLGL